MDTNSRSYSNGVCRCDVSPLEKSPEPPIVFKRRTPVQSVYLFREQIGRGKYGVVYTASQKSSGFVRAIKKLPKQSATNLAKYHNEIALLQVLDHPRIIRMYEVYEDYGFLYFVMEYCRGGDLYERLRSERSIPESTAAYFMSQVLSAIAACHSAGIVHRDIKPENFLFSECDARSPLKLADFGLGRMLPSTTLTTVAGTASYLAPEVFDHKGYTQSADIWSAGIMLYVMLYDRFPFGHGAESDREIIANIINGSMTFNHPHRKISPVAEDFLRALCRRNPDERLTATVALKHPWVRQHTPSILRTLPLLLAGDPLTDPISFCCDLSELGHTHAQSCRSSIINKRDPDTIPRSEEELLWLRIRTTVAKLGLGRPEEVQALGERMLARWHVYSYLPPIKKGLIRVLATQIDHTREVCYLQTLFDMLDVKGLGKLTCSELQNGVMTLIHCGEQIDFYRCKIQENSKDEVNISESGNEPSVREQGLMSASNEALSHAGETLSSPANNRVDPSQVNPITLRVFREMIIDSDENSCIARPLGDFKQWCDLQRLVGVLDLNGDGTISVSEFIASCLDPLTFTSPAADQALFRFLDRDSDGRLSWEELHSALGLSDSEEEPNTPQPPTDNKIPEGGSVLWNIKHNWQEGESSSSTLASSFRQADTNEDGFLDYEEFIALLVRDEGGKSATLRNSFSPCGSRLYIADVQRVGSDMSMQSHISSAHTSFGDLFNFNDVMLGR